MESAKATASGQDDESQYILELNNLALDEEQGVIAVLKAYMDESGIHDGSAVCTVAAYLARPNDWAEWTKRWKIAKRPIGVFHAADCANFHGEFKGWEKSERDAYVAKLLAVLPEMNLPGIVVGINIDELDKAMHAHEGLREFLGTPYSACFQWATQIIMNRAYQSGSSERIGFIHETNDFRQEALEAFSWVEKYGNPNKTWISLTFGSKQRYVPLQAADILAYEGNKRLRDPKAPVRRAWTALDPDKTRIQCWYYGKSNTAELISRLESVRAGKIPQPNPSQSWLRNFPELSDWPLRS